MLVDVAARNASLDNDYGDDRGPNAAGSHAVALVDVAGAELSAETSPGYARPVIVPSDWPAAVDGQKTVLVTFPAPEGEWDEASGWFLIDPVTGTVWDAGDLVDLLLVTSSSPEGPTVAITVAYQT